jgi:hypothetical protein
VVSEVAKLADNVDHPAHYQMAGGIEVIDVIESAIEPINDPREAMCLANVLKYCLRYRFKGGLESLKKARWYLDRMIAYMEKRDANFGNYQRKERIEK